MMIFTYTLVTVNLTTVHLELPQEDSPLVLNQQQEREMCGFCDHQHV